MRLTIVGASGGIGRQLVRLGLGDGHEVTAVVRDPAKLETPPHERLHVMRGNALDAESIAGAVDGADAVLSAMGAAGRVDPLRPASTSAAAVASAMKAAGVRRVVVVSAGPLNRDGAGQPAWIRLASKPLGAILKDAYADLARMETILADSGLDWTSVRPSRLTDKPGKGTYRLLIEAGPAGFSIARADVARAMLDTLGDPTTVGHAVGVSD